MLGQWLPPVIPQRFSDLFSEYKIRAREGGWNGLTVKQNVSHIS